MKKILWITNHIYNDQDIKNSGTWSYSMGKALEKKNIFEIYNMVPTIKLKNIEQCNYNNFIQWKIPLYNNANRKVLNELIKLIHSINPDIIHIWGTERGWAKFFVESLNEYTILLETVGILSAVANNYFGNIPKLELIRNIGFKEILKPSTSIFNSKRKLVKETISQSNIIKKSSNISVQSEWAKNHILLVNPDCNLFETKIMLREEFYTTKPWNIEQGRKNLSIFTVSSCSSPLKGGHILFRAFSFLKKKFPQLKLKIAGEINLKGIRKNAYTRYLMRLAKELNIIESIEWLGALSAVEMIKHMHNSSVFVTPSFIESYSLTIAEATMIGIPCAASYTGALPELDNFLGGILYFPVGDAVMCASQIEKILSSQEFSNEISLKSRAYAKIRNNYDIALATQLKIYKSLMTKNLEILI